MDTNHHRPTGMTGRTSRRYYTLDFWRGVACLMVIFFHASFYVTKNPAYECPDPVSRLLFALFDLFWLGVPLFFVISGYCITAACDAVRSKPHTVSRYFLRRFRRIFPPYWIFVGLAFLAVSAASFLGWRTLFHDEIFPIPDPLSLSAWQWLGNLGLVETWRFHVVGRDQLFFLGHAWSLCYEEQFYAVCGLLLFTTRQRFFHALAGLSALVAGLTAVRLLGWRMPVVGFFFDGRWLLFAAGVLVYWRLHYADRRWARWSEIGLGVGAAVMAGLQWIRPHYLALELSVGLVFALVICRLHRWDIPLARSRVLRPVTFCGIMCYSLYLIHWPVVKAASHGLYLAGIRGAWPTLAITVPVCVAVSVGIAWAFHLAVERRFLNTPAVMPHRLLAQLENRKPPHASTAVHPQPVS